MGYRIDINHAGCITCGICMDVCPVEALDMSRPDHPGIETGPVGGKPLPWMVERPLQVGECIGCGICVRECPPAVISIATLRGEEVPLAPRQGPIERPAPYAANEVWMPLSEVTHESMKATKPSPWGDLFPWVTRSRPKPWQAWMTMVDEGPANPIAPCQEACPAGTDAGRYVGLVAQGRFDEAYQVAAEVNPFPSVCGWICTAPCESACRRGVLDEPISIRTIKRFAVEHGKLPPAPKPARQRSEKVAIVGGGPAGMSAAWYLACLGYPVTVMEAMPVPGAVSRERPSRTASSSIPWSASHKKLAPPRDSAATASSVSSPTISTWPTNERASRTVWTVAESVPGSAATAAAPSPGFSAKRYDRAEQSRSCP